MAKRPTEDDAPDVPLGHVRRQSFVLLPHTPLKSRTEQMVRFLGSIGSRNMLVKVVCYLFRLHTYLAEVNLSHSYTNMVELQYRIFLLTSGLPKAPGKLAKLEQMKRRDNAVATSCILARQLMGMGRWIETSRQFLRDFRQAFDGTAVAIAQWKARLRQGGDTTTDIAPHNDNPFVGNATGPSQQGPAWWTRPAHLIVLAMRVGNMLSGDASFLVATNVAPASWTPEYCGWVYNFTKAWSALFALMLDIDKFLEVRKQPLNPPRDNESPAPLRESFSFDGSRSPTHPHSEWSSPKPKLTRRPSFGETTLAHFRNFKAAVIGSTAWFRDGRLRLLRISALRNLLEMLVYFSYLPWYKPPTWLRLTCGLFSGASGAYLGWENAGDLAKPR